MKFLLASKNFPLMMGSELLNLHVPSSIFESCGQECSAVFAMHVNTKTYYINLDVKDTF